MIFKDNLVSVIIPVYRVEIFLPDCLESIMNQTYKNLEIILVDDGSPDRCGEICEKYATLDERIIVVHQDNNGLSGARNTGIRTAHGDYLAFVDSDDWVEPNYIEELIKHADFDTIVSCGFWEENVWTYEHRGRLNQYSKDEAISFYLDDELNYALGKNHILMGSYAWNKLYPSCIFKTVQYPETKKFEDIFTVIDILKCCERLVTLNQCLYHYRIRDGAITATKNKENQYHHLEGRIHQEDVLKDESKLLLKARALSLLAVTYIYKESYNGDYLLSGLEKKELKEYIRERLAAMRLLTLRKQVLIKILLYFEWFCRLYFKLKHIY